MSSRRVDIAAYGSLILLTVCVYYPVLGCGFVNLDDPPYVSKNPRVLSGLAFSGIGYAFTTYDVGHWIPLTWLSYLADATIYGDNPAGYHLTNLALHVL